MTACETTGSATKSPGATAGASTGEHGSAASGAQVASRNDAVASVAFIDSSTFDTDLHSALSRDPGTVHVTPAAPFSLNKIPPRIDKWLAAVKSSGGKVAARQDTALATRGLIGMVIDVVVALFDQAAEKALYAPAEKYDATLYYGADGKVDRVLFTRK
ncbi:MAG: hypothetical protein OEU46_23850 [Alphaproteobacteria bacterium]|nr:hypothetical protein [Alphaproteobacteria bacterium]